VSAVLEPKPGFDWAKVTWGRPDSLPSVLCSYCSASLGGLGDRCGDDDAVPLIMWDKRGYTARFCTKCQKEWWGMESFEEEPE
jgi:hypothetical protein